jgi:superfamily I DNA/RNA helicase
MSLADYDGLPINHVKVGTYHRAKGLEFAHVFIPDLHQTPRPRAVSETEDAVQERCELEHRQLFVAMTRARDGLWLCQIDPTATNAPADSDTAIA